MTTVELDTTLTCIFTHLGGHLIITIVVRRWRRVVPSGIPEPEAEVSYRVVAFRVLQTVDRILQAILGNAIIEASATHYACGNPDDFLQCTGGVHDG